MSYGSNTYTYNADGIRTSKTVNGVKHIYHLSRTQILSEEWTEGNVQHILIFVYDASGNPIGMSHYENGAQRGTYVFVKNIQGDIIGIYDDEGTCLVTYTYDAWGNVTVSYSNGGASTAARYNPFRYRGYYYDNETSLYYLNSRYYDPNVGRFLNADGYINANGDLLGFNMFAYCGNNPVNYKDDSGGSATLVVLGVAIGLKELVGLALISVATIVVLKYALDPDFREGFNDTITSAWDDLVDGVGAIRGGITKAKNLIISGWESLSKGIGDSFANTKRQPDYRSRTERHHIVARTSPHALMARSILREVNIKIDSNENIIEIKTGLHRRLHTLTYYKLVDLIIVEAYESAGNDKIKQRDSVLSALGVIKNILGRLSNISLY